MRHIFLLSDILRYLLTGWVREMSALNAVRGYRQFFGEYSTTPPASRRPRRMVSPRARRISSTVRNFPCSVESLNHPRWSAMRCLEKGEQQVEQAARV